MSRPRCLRRVGLSLALTACTTAEVDGVEAPAAGRPPASATAAGAPMIRADDPLPVAPPVVAATSLVLRCAPGVRACRFRGTIQSVRPAGIPPRGSGGAVTSGWLVTLEGSPPPCRVSALQGVPRDAVLAQEPVDTHELLVALPPNRALPLREGESICGAVRAFSLGYDPGEDGLVATPAGDVLLARSDAMPHELPPLPGWSFALGALLRRLKQDDDFGYAEHAVRVTHGGSTATVAHPAGVELPGGPEESHWVEAEGYTTQGKLPVWGAWRGAQGYGFSLVRLRAR